LNLGITHLAGAIGSLQTVLPFKLATTDESLTAHSGLALFGEYLRAMGVGGLIDHELPGPGSAAGYDSSAHVFPLVLLLAGGGRTLEDLGVLRNEAGSRIILQTRGARDSLILSHCLSQNSNDGQAPSAPRKRRAF
jgi:hypothetical protein